MSEISDRYRRVAGRFTERTDDMLRTSGHYGPKVAAAADADEQTRLIAFTGRRP